MLKNTTMWFKSLLLAGVVALILLVQGLATKGAVSDVDSRVQNEYSVMLPTLESSYNLKIQIIQIQQWLTDISATRGLDGLNDGFDEAEVAFQSALQSLDDLNTHLPEKQNALRELRDSLQNYYQVGKTMAQAYIDGGPAQGNQTMDAFDKASEALQNKTQALVEHINQLRATSKEQVNSSLEAASFLTFLSFFITLIAIGILIFLLRLWILQPLDQFNLLFNKLNQGEANLSFRFSDIYQNEIGSIKLSFNQFMEKLQKMAHSITDKSQLIQNDVQNLDDSTTRIDHQTTQQISRIELLATSMNQLTANSTEVQSAMGGTAKNMNKLEEYLRAGYQASDQAELSTLNVAKRIDESAEVVQKLESHTSEIVAMVDNIQAIAEQTNLLALNAASEAARAGEQGRGFAVVADEVRALASRTQTSTKEINDIIQTLKSAASSAVGTMQQCHSEVSICVDYAQTSKQNTELSLQSANSTLEDVLSVNKVMEQQTRVVAENTQHIADVHESNGELARIVQHTSADASSIRQQAEELARIALTFDKAQ